MQMEIIHEILKNVHACFPEIMKLWSDQDICQPVAAAEKSWCMYVQKL